MRDLERENQLLRKLVHDQATLIKELLESMPEDIRELPQTQRGIETSKKLIESMEFLDGSTLSTPDNRQ